MRLLAILAILAALPLHAATYYVRKTGNDSNPGTTGSAWLTLGKATSTAVAGDTVIVGDGDYNEHVQESTSGTSGNLITYQAENRGQAAIRAFRFSGQYIKVDGFKIDKYSGVSNTWAAGVRFDSGAHNNTLTNCTIENMPYVIAPDFSFNSATQTITSASSNFITAGFVAGSKVYLGASGAEYAGQPLYYANHDTTWTVASLTATTMTLTAGSATFLADAGTGYWAFVRAGSGNSGFAAIEWFVSGGVGANNITVTNNTIQNWPGHAIKIRGTDALVEGNTLRNLLSFRALQWEGSNITIRRNRIIDCPNIIHYTENELANIEHPAGTGWYDYQVGMMSGFIGSFASSTNVLVEDNWFENVENQLGRIDDEQPGTTGAIFQRNTFVGVTEQFSGGRDEMKWRNNTFFRCALGTAGHPLTLGGRPPAQTGYEISGNIFVACGKPGLTESQTRGFYSISSNATSPVTGTNFVAGEELMGFAPKSAFTEGTGINGGDPVFFNALDPDGADNIPWTADDGLKVLASSPAAALGGGSLGVRPVATGQPVAHFRVSSPTGWWEGVGESFDPTWDDIPPTQRGAPARPYTTVPSFAGTPATVTFDASKSVSGVAGSSTNAAITNYSWNWGDGTPVTSGASATASHTFTSPGTRTVTLTVTNSTGGTSSYSSVYRFPGVAKRVPADYATIQLAVDSAVAGDTILVTSGTHTGTVRTKSSGTANSRITLEMEAGAKMAQLQVEHPYWTIRNVLFEGTIAQNSAYLLIRRGAHFTRVEGVEIDGNYAPIVGVETINNPAIKRHGIEFETPATQPFGTDAPSDCVVTGARIHDLLGATFVTLAGDRNIVENCTLYDGGSVDFFRVWGRNNVIRGNSCSNNYVVDGTGNHPDFIQTFGNNGFGSQYITIERNVVNYIENGGLTQLEGNLVEEISDWTFRNNIFVRVANTASQTIPNVKHLNNTYYKCCWRNKGHALSFGGRAYGKASVSPSQAEYATLAVEVVSGSLTPGLWYSVAVPSGIGTQTVTYNGATYGSGEEFQAVDGVLTYTKTHASVFVGRAMVNFAHGATVKNCAFIECGDGTNTKGWYSVADTFGALTGTALDYNFVSGTAYAAKRVGTAQYPDVGYLSTRWFEAHGVNGGNPLVWDETTFDFRLRSGSPLIDVGTTVAEAPNDYVGTSRPIGAAFDIGAYEFVDDGSEPPPPPVDPGTINPPSGLAAIAIGAYSVSLVWVDESNNETAFEVQRSLDQTAWTTVATRPTNTQGWTESGLQPDTTYFYRVRATSSLGLSTWSNSTAATTAQTPPVIRRFPRGARRGASTP